MRTTMIPEGTDRISGGHGEGKTRGTPVLVFVRSCYSADDHRPPDVVLPPSRRRASPSSTTLPRTTTDDETKDGNGDDVCRRWHPRPTHSSRPHRRTRRRQRGRSRRGTTTRSVGCGSGGRLAVRGTSPRGRGPTTRCRLESPPGCGLSRSAVPQEPPRDE